MTEPTDRSMPPEMTTTVIPTAITAIQLIVVNTDGIRFDGRRNRSPHARARPVRARRAPQQQHHDHQPQFLQPGKRRRRTGSPSDRRPAQCPWPPS